MFNINYLAMHKVQMHAGATSIRLLHGFVSVRAIIHSLKLVVYLPIQTHKPYINLHTLYFIHRKRISFLWYGNQNIQIFIVTMKYSYM